MFGADYPLLKFDRLFADWESEGYSKEILEKVYHKNAMRLFEGLGRQALSQLLALIEPRVALRSILRRPLGARAA